MLDVRVRHVVSRWQAVLAGIHSRSEMTYKDMQVLYRVELEVKKVDPVHLFHGLDDTESDECCETLSIRRALRHS